MTHSRDPRRAVPWWTRPGLAYEQRDLCLAGRSLAKLARAHGTPLYVYDFDAIQAALSGFAAAGPIHDIHNVRVRDTNAGEIVNFHCRATPSMSVARVHESVDEIERALRRAFPTVKRVISHAEPPYES